MLPWFNIALFLVSALFFSMSLRSLWTLRWTHRLPTRRSNPHPQELSGAQPQVSVIIAARDEAGRIGQTLSRILKQEQVQLEVIVVDDRSRDGTSEVVGRVASQDPRVRALRIEVLPVGWLGKCHALHRGAAEARGEWLFFTDADCWIKPDGLVRALEVAAEAQVQHITLTPGVDPHTIWAQGWHLGFTMIASGWIAGANRDRPRAHIGAGAFNLVQSDLYRKWGGHETLRLAVVDDVKLGFLVRRSGGRTRAFLGGDDAECHWGVTVSEGVRLMEKNFFALVEYRVGVAVGAFVLMGSAFGFAWVAPWTGRPWAWLPLAGVMSLAVPARVAAKKLEWGWAGALACPLTFPVAYYALLRSAVLTLKRGGIRWRDTFYPLETLRRASRELR